MPKWEPLKPKPPAAKSAVLQPPALPEDDVLMQPKTIQDARSDGAITGTMISAPLAPAKGPITMVPEVVRATDGMPAQEPMVVLAVKAFWDSPTIKAARNVIGGALLAVLGVLFTTFTSVWTSGRSVFEAGAVNWRATEIAAEIAFGTIVATAFFAFMKRRDNNPVQK